MTQSDKRVGELLIEQGILTPEVLETVLAEQENLRSQSESAKPLGEMLIDRHLVDEIVFYRFLAERNDMEFINLSLRDLELNHVKLLPRHIAQKYSVIVVEADEEQIVVATHDPYNKFAIEDVRTFLRNEHIRVVVATLNAINTKISLHYSHLVVFDYTEAEADTPDDKSFSFKFDNPAESVTIDDNEVIRKINGLLENGYAKSASDIHIEPFETETVIRMRVDGAIKPYQRIRYPRGMQAPHNEMIASIKIRSGLDIAEKRLPQDGQMFIDINNKRINIRTSVIPTYYGEKAVLRYLNQNIRIDDAEHFGMGESDYRIARQMLDMPNGIIYVTGATGSGKTSTLYMMLDYLAKKDVSIATIEDPIERNIPHVCQMQVNIRAGLTFERGLRAILRQDPDIFMVGETRDEETAQISARAAITGHLVLSSLHTNDAVSSIARLVDMQVPRYMVAVSLVGLIAQRLVRKVCKNCGQPYEPSAKESEMLGGYTGVLYHANREGCAGCNFGYVGRVPVHEMLPVDDDVRRMINADTPAKEIENYCVAEKGMVRLSERIKQLVYKGVITIDEYMRYAAK